MGRRSFIGSPRLANRALGALYVAGGLFALISIVVPHGRHFATAAALVSALVAGGVGAAIWRARPLNERWAQILVDVAGVLLVGGIFSGRHTPVSQSSTVFLVWVALAAGLFLPPRKAALHLAVIGAAFTAVLATRGGAAAPTEAVYVIGTACMAGIVTAYSRAELTALAKTDFLTGLPNREELYRVLEKEISRSDRGGTPVAVAMLDLDEFKAINDDRGHQAGDEALVALAGAWSAQLRPSDLLARFGGDEFVLVMPATDHAQASCVMSRLRSGAPDYAWSAGVAVRRTGEDANVLLARADAALYEDKQARRANGLPPGTLDGPCISSASRP